MKFPGIGFPIWLRSLGGLKKSFPTDALNQNFLSASIRFILAATLCLWVVAPFSVEAKSKEDFIYADIALTRTSEARESQGMPQTGEIDEEEVLLDVLLLTEALKKKILLKTQELQGQYTSREEAIKELKKRIQRHDRYISIDIPYVGHAELNIVDDEFMLRVVHKPTERAFFLLEPEKIARDSRHLAMFAARQNLDARSYRGRDLTELFVASQDGRHIWENTDHEVLETKDVPMDPKYFSLKEETDFWQRQLKGKDISEERKTDLRLWALVQTEITKDSLTKQFLYKYHQWMDATVKDKKPDLKWALFSTAVQSIIMGALITCKYYLQGDPMATMDWSPLLVTVPNALFFGAYQQPFKNWVDRSPHVPVKKIKTMANGVITSVLYFLVSGDPLKTPLTILNSFFVDWIGKKARLEYTEKVVAREEMRVNYGKWGSTNRSQAEIERFKVFLGTSYFQKSISNINITFDGAPVGMFASIILSLVPAPFGVKAALKEAERLDAESKAAGGPGFSKLGKYRAAYKEWREHPILFLADIPSEKAYGFLKMFSLAVSDMSQRIGVLPKNKCEGLLSSAYKIRGQEPDASGQRDVLEHSPGE